MMVRLVPLAFALSVFTRRPVLLHSSFTTGLERTRSLHVPTLTVKFVDLLLCCGLQNACSVTNEHLFVSAE